MKPPLSQSLRASVFIGNSTSGRCRTSTRTDDSANTRGCNCSSSSVTISCTERSYTSADTVLIVTVQEK